VKIIIQLLIQLKINKVLANKIKDMKKRIFKKKIFFFILIFFTLPLILLVNFLFFLTEPHLKFLNKFWKILSLKKKL